MTSPPLYAGGLPYFFPRTPSPPVIPPAQELLNILSVQDIPQGDTPHSAGRFFISSPNASWIPQLPWHQSGDVFSYYTDGMLGIHKHAKWPQVWNPAEPHLIVAPLSPKMQTLGGDPRLPSDLPIFRPSWMQTTPDFNIWRDQSVVWDDFERSSWTLAFLTDGGRLGRVDPKIPRRLRRAAKECSDRALDMASRRYPELDNRRMYVSQQVVRLSRAIDELVDTVVKLIDAIMWYREAQRLLLDIHAWCDYQHCLKPLWDQSLTSEVTTPYFPAKVRGAITSHLPMVRRLFALGIPVWYLRPAHSFTKATKFSLLPHEPVTKVDKFFSTTRTSTIGDVKIIAPTWLDSANLDSSMVSIQDQLRRFTLTNRPSISASVAVIQEVTDPVADAHEQGLPPNPETSARGGNVAGIVPPPLPPWAPAYDPLWLDALKGMSPLRPPKKMPPSNTTLPPTSMFLGTSQQVSGWIHNWLCVRPWVHITAKGKILEGKCEKNVRQWRIALEGKYYGLQPRENDRFKPTSSLQDIAHLPPVPALTGPPPAPSIATPPSTQSLGLRKRQRTTAPTLSNDAPPSKKAKSIGQKCQSAKGKEHRFSERIDINVLFGVKGGFVQQDHGMWAEVVWELSVNEFRLEFIRLDMIQVPDLNLSAEATCVRQEKIQAIWRDDGDVLVKFTDVVHPKDLAISVMGIDRWAEVMQPWPVLPGHEGSLLRPKPRTSGSDARFHAEVAPKHATSAFNELELPWFREQVTRKDVLEKLNTLDDKGNVLLGFQKQAVELIVTAYQAKFGEILFPEETEESFTQQRKGAARGVKIVRRPAENEQQRVERCEKISGRIASQLKGVR
ncbi:hypothetical protein OF83DRAFT_1180247 [Amylostereum chailletii]|nr:hypothetical protein OF83DRAFT_1180247 [Amylostereum chailletii]